jgi:hypothetical protein
MVVLSSRISLTASQGVAAKDVVSPNAKCAIINAASNGLCLGKVRDILKYILLSPTWQF